MPILAPSPPSAIELFCGIGGFRIASDKSGFKTIWANDISQPACSVYRKKFPGTALHQGDINHLLDATPSHELLTAGFPCQPFSAAGKKNGTRDPRGTLFQSIVDILKRHSPKYFVLENVKRLLSMENGAHFSTVLSALSELDYFIEWRVLNAKNFGLAQNRERIFIIGTRIDDFSVNPKDRLRLAHNDDLLSAPKGMTEIIQTAPAWRSIGDSTQKFAFWGLASKGKFITQNLNHFSQAFEPVFLKEILEDQVSPKHDFTDETKRRLHENELVNKFVNGVEIISNQAGGARMGYTIFGTGGLSPTLTASTSRHYERYKINERYRRLTPNEYARLQGFPDNHCESASTSEQYSLLGNAVPPAMAEWAIKQVIDESTRASSTTLRAQGEFSFA